MENSDPFDLNLPTSEIVSKFTDNIKGIGPFTIKTLLEWRYAVMDIAQDEDIVFRRGLAKIYNLDKKLSVKDSIKITQKWGKYSSVGSRFCFQAAYL